MGVVADLGVVIVGPEMLKGSSLLNTPLQNQG
jgi:hypothetical protein